MEYAEEYAGMRDRYAPQAERTLPPVSLAPVRLTIRRGDDERDLGDCFTYLFDSEGPERRVSIQTERGRLFVTVPESALRTYERSREMRDGTRVPSFVTVLTLPCSGTMDGQPVVLSSEATESFLVSHMPNHHSAAEIAEARARFGLVEPDEEDPFAE